MQVGEEQLELGQGKCCVIRPGESMSVTDYDADSRYYVIRFAPEGEAADLFRFLTEARELGCVPFARALELLDELYVLRFESDDLPAFRWFVRFQELMLFLCEQNQTHATVEEKNRNDNGVEQSIRYVQQHFRELLTVEKLADIAGVDRWKYTRLFKEMTGQVPLQYLNELRMKHARKWLAATDDKLLDIALNAGFNNEYYFSRRFKQTVGISPGEYRRIRREQPRVVAPFLEDYMVALGLQPIVQYSHPRWGRQEFLGLNEVPTFDDLGDDLELLSGFSPDLILLTQRYWQHEHALFRRISNTCVLPDCGEDWRSLLCTMADWFGRGRRAQQVLAEYEAKAHAARQKLSRCMRKETVAFLRISADHILQYKAGGQGFAVAVLYEDLGLRPFVVSETLPTDSSNIVWLDIDRLPELKADHLFITFDKWHSREAGAERELLKRVEWRELPAVRNNRVYEVDFLTWANRGALSNGKKIDDILRALT